MNTDSKQPPKRRFYSGAINYHGRIDSEREFAASCADSTITPKTVIYSGTINYQTTIKRLSVIATITLSPPPYIGGGVIVNVDSDPVFVGGHNGPDGVTRSPC